MVILPHMQLSGVLLIQRPISGVAQHLDSSSSNRSNSSGTPSSSPHTVRYQLAPQEEPVGSVCLGAFQPSAHSSLEHTYWGATLESAATPTVDLDQQNYVAPGNHQADTISPTSIHSLDTQARILGHQSTPQPSPPQLEEGPPLPDPFSRQKLSPSDILWIAHSLVETVTANPDEHLPRTMLEPLIQAILLPPSTQGKGSRNGTEYYLCMWPGCGQKITRHDHSLDHVAAHAGSKPEACHRWWVQQRATAQPLTSSSIPLPFVLSLPLFITACVGSFEKQTSSVTSPRRAVAENLARSARVSRTTC